MQNTLDDKHGDLATGNVADDERYPPFRHVTAAFNKMTRWKMIMGSIHSSVNDAFFYGNLTYQFFVKTLGVIPTDKLRLRVHYGSLFDQYAFWDGAYANFSDTYPFYFSLVSWILSLEIAHGVLTELTDSILCGRAK